MRFHKLTSSQNGSAIMIVVFIVVLALIGGAGAYVATGGFKNGGDNTNSQQTNKNFKSVTATSTADLKTMFAAAKADEYDIKCTLNYDKSAASKNALLPVSGPATLYVDGAKKMRVDMTISGKSSHFMRLGQSAYLWNDGATKGSEFPITNESATSTSSQLSTESFADNAKNYDLKCQSVADLDVSLFILPTGVTFTEVNSTLNSTRSTSN
jgi:hypothetical protein